MNWIQRTPYYIESFCERYWICKVTVDGVAQYEATFKPKDAPKISLGRGIKTADEAKAICEQHAKGVTDAKAKA